MSSDSESDDEFLNSGLNMKKRKTRGSDTKSAASLAMMKQLNNNLKYAEEKRRCLTVMSQIKAEEDVCDKAEENLKQHERIGSAQRERELEEMLEGAAGGDAAMQQAMETGLSTLLGTRVTLKKQNYDEPCWDAMAKKIREKPLLKWCKDVSAKGTHFLGLALRSKALVKKFDTLPACLTNWLIETAYSSSELSDGAFQTLKAYSEKNPKFGLEITLKDAERKLNDLLLTEPGEGRHTNDMLVDLHHALLLWTEHIGRDDDIQTITSILVMLANVSLDPTFHVKGIPG